jgi:hypothetical protein
MQAEHLKLFKNIRYLMLQLYRKALINRVGKLQRSKQILILLFDFVEMANETVE